MGAPIRFEITVDHLCRLKILRNSNNFVGRLSAKLDAIYVDMKHGLLLGSQ
jgi:hypothetical protein